MALVGRPVILATQLQKEQTSNDSDSWIERAWTNTYTVSLASASVVLNQDRFNRAVRVKVTGCAAVSRSITVPQQVRGFFIVESDSANTFQFSVAYGNVGTDSRFVVQPGERKFFYADGTLTGIFDLSARVGIDGQMATAIPIGFSNTRTPTTALNIAVGSAIAVPFWIAARFRLINCRIRSTDTASARQAHFRLYQQIRQGDATVFQALAHQGDFAFSGTGGGSYQENIAGFNIGSLPPLNPGLYWLVLRNQHASNTLGLGTQSAGSMAANTAQTKSVGTLSNSIDLKTGWTKIQALPAIALRGKVFGQSTTF